MSILAKRTPGPLRAGTGRAADPDLPHRVAAR